MMEIEKEMDVEDSHIRCKQRTAESEKVLDYDYKKCVGCSICVALCPKKALAEGPLQEIAKGMDAPPVLIDPDACVFCGMLHQLLSRPCLQDDGQREGADNRERSCNGDQLK